MPIYEFQCPECGHYEQHVHEFAKAPTVGSAIHACPTEECSGEVARILSMPDLCLGESDPDHVPPDKAVTTHRNLMGTSKAQAEKIERAYARDISEKRKMARESGSTKMERSIPAHLYHGKIRQTGDQNYWDDPKNRSKHASTKI